MSKSMIEAFTRGQFRALSAKDNKERLRFTIAGIKDGKLYDFVGTDYGVFDAECDDYEFISESDLKLSRITGTKIASITLKMQKFFDNYNHTESKEDEAPSKEDEAPSKEDEAPSKEDEFDTEAVEAEFKKCLKKGKLKKAQKLLVKLEGLSMYDKLSKKLNKAQSEG